MGVSVGVLDHFNIRTHKLADTVRFYEDVLGLEKGARPNFAFPGAWMYSEGRPVVHLVDISKTDEPQKPDSGVVHHVAFISRGFAGMKQRLETGGFEFDSRRRSLADLRQ
jgi:catechol 2,3-dioxygenase-like lactoylglutathione lyase family enzyme